MSEKFNLKWNDFQTNVSRSFGLFRNESYLHDVTLVSDDCKQIPAHKLVLSACSEYFKNILQQTKQSQPLLCLYGMNSIDLQNVLDYVYEGEVRIYQEDLDRFLNVAQKLKLEGLKGQDSNENEQKEEFHPQSNLFPDMQFEETSIPVKPNPSSSNNIVKSQNQSTSRIVAINDNFNPEEHKLKLNEQITMNEDKSATCNICGKTSKPSKDARANMRNHVEIHYEGLSYPCPLCEKTFRLAISLANHKTRAHNHIKF